MVRNSEPADTRCAEIWAVCSGISLLCPWRLLTGEIRVVLEHDIWDVVRPSTALRSAGQV